MSFNLRKINITEELELAKQNKNVRSVNLAGRNIEVYFHFTTSDEYQLNYLTVRLNKNLDNDRPFDFYIVKNELSPKIKIEEIIHYFLNNFVFEKGGITLKDFFNR